jgi:hypothetical protein
MFYSYLFIASIVGISGNLHNFHGSPMLLLADATPTPPCIENALKLLVDTGQQNS